MATVSLLFLWHSSQWKFCRPFILAGSPVNKPRRQRATFLHRDSTGPPRPIHAAQRPTHDLIDSARSAACCTACCVDCTSVPVASRPDSLLRSFGRLCEPSISQPGFDEARTQRPPPRCRFRTRARASAPTRVPGEVGRGRGGGRGRGWWSGG